MNRQLSLRNPLDPGHHGLTLDDFPPLGDAPEPTRTDLRRLWHLDANPKTLPSGTSEDNGVQNTPDHQPLEIEIGSGKGTFLVQQASAHPDTYYLGIEYAKAFWRHAADRCRRNQLESVRLLHADAKVFIHWYVADESVDQVHIYFPDPWPKARHNKRRLIQRDFLIDLHRILRPDGIVRIVTDHTDYFTWMQDHLAQVTDYFASHPFESPAAAGEGEIVGTNFERKYRREGRPFNALACIKRPHPRK